MSATSPTTVAKQLQQFYRDYHAWVVKGDNPYEFVSQYGLCTNLDIWCTGTHRDNVVFRELRTAMELQFLEAGLITGYPFDSDSVDYWKERDKRDNPTRMEWVRKHC